VIDDHLHDGITILSNCNVALTTGRAQNVGAARFELRGNTAPQTAGCSGYEKQLAAEFHAAMLTHIPVGRTILRRYFGW
jgi:hypothetical protein